MGHRLGGTRCIRDFAYRLIMENGKMTTNEIWAAAHEDKRQIAFSSDTNQVSNRLRASPLFTQHGTVRQRAARGAVSGGSIPGQNQRVGLAGIGADAHWYDTPLWDIVDLDAVAQVYVEKSHPFNVRRLPAILRIKLVEMGVIE